MVYLAILDLPQDVCHLLTFRIVSTSIIVDRLRKLVTDNLKSIGFDMSSPLPVHEVDYELDPAVRDVT